MAKYETGTVKWFDDSKGCGIILLKNGDEVFVHYSAILCGEETCSLESGNKVQFIIFKGPRGKQAQNVMVIN